MSDPIIQVEHLGKRYRIQHQQGGMRYVALRDVLAEAAKKPWRWLTARRPQTTRPQDHETSPLSRSPVVSSPRTEDFWALRDVSFSVRQGEVLGIIGRNGAGKSTLLKILSRITEPTEGRVRIRGRVASLLEVGTGFHAELTGRENIFLNGAILGMTRAEIKRKFDEIVAFSEVEKFLDTPVKRYSSGMYVRLAFAVAAHLEPEILVVDEVLAVGDAEFQKKCLGKMQSVATQEGRTVLFVSHNMKAVEQLCSSALRFDRGSLLLSTSNVAMAIRQYLFGTCEAGESESATWLNTGQEYQNMWFQPLRFYATDSNSGNILRTTNSNTNIWVRIEADVHALDPSLTVGYALYNQDGHLLYWSRFTDVAQEHWPVIRIGRNVLKSQIPVEFLNEGNYRLEMMGSLHGREWLFQPGVNAPTIFLTVIGGQSKSPIIVNNRPGILAPNFRWYSDESNT